MKETAIALCLSTFFSLMIRAQIIVTEDKVNKVLTVKLVQKNDYYDKYTKEAAFAIRNDTIYSVVVYPKEDELDYLRSEFYQGPFKQKYKFFEFNFKADPLVFRKDYPKMDLPTKQQIESIKSNVKIDSGAYYRVSRICLYADSTVLTFRLKPLPQKDLKNSRSVISTPPYGRSAEFLGNLKTVEKEIAEKIRLKKVKTGIDSIIVFRALVTREEYPLSDNLIVEKLLFGKSSTFSKTVKDVLLSQENRKFWRAAVSGNTGQRMTTRIKIFAQLNKNGTVEIQLPRFLANWTGD